LAVVETYALHSSIKLYCGLQTAGPKNPEPCTVTTSPGATFDVGKMLVITAARAGATSISKQAATTEIAPRAEKRMRRDWQWRVDVGRDVINEAEQQLCPTIGATGELI
jgi:hypothetical protein